jgi:DNA-directed RNA polymerase specialized sigma24 family protein
MSREPKQLFSARVACASALRQVVRGCGPVEVDTLWPLFREVARDPAAWPALLAALEPELIAIARRQPIGRLRDRDDTPREIVSRVFARLHARDHAAIHKLCAIDPPPELRAWLRVLVRRSAIDYMRAHSEYERATPTRPDRWISLATLTSAAPARGPDSLAEQRALVLTEVRALVARAEAELRAHGDDAFGALALEWRLSRLQVRRLAVHGARFVDVLVATLAGHAQTEIAAQLALTRREVELTVRYLEELLRARFAAG